jgi:hypothetical protein
MTRACPAGLDAGPDHDRAGWALTAAVPASLGGVPGGLVAALTVGKIGRCRWSPVMRSIRSACGETAAKRRNPPSALARRPVPTSTASPLASQKLTLDMSMTSRLEPGRSKPKSCSRRSEALAMSSSPANSAMVMRSSVRAERSRPRWAAITGFTIGFPIRSGGPGCPTAAWSWAHRRCGPGGLGGPPFWWLARRLGRQ